MIYISNAFSLQMLGNLPTDIHIAATTAEEVAAKINEAGFASAVGHPDMATIITNMLGREIPHNRINIALHRGDLLYVAQVMGGRLPEGATELPPGARIEWRAVLVMSEREAEA